MVHHRRIPLLGAIFVALSIGALMTPANAQSLKSLRAQAEEEEALRNEAAYTMSKCGIDFSVSIDWGASSSWPAEKSLASACDGALSAVEAMCKKPGARPIKAFTCAGDNRGASFSGGSLRYGAGEGRNAFEETLGVLQ